MRLAGLCGTPTDCYVKRYNEIDKLIRDSDIHDFENVRAADRIKLLPAPSDEPGLIGRTFQTFDLDRYERNLSELHLIEEGIVISMKIRVITEGELRSGSEALNLIDSQVKAQVALDKGRDANLYLSAARAVEGVLPAIKNARSHLDVAATGSSFLRPKAQAEVARSLVMEKNVRTLVAQWDNKSDGIIRSDLAKYYRDQARMVR